MIHELEQSAPCRRGRRCAAGAVTVSVMLLSAGCAPEAGGLPTAGLSAPSATSETVKSIVLAIPTDGYLQSSVWSQVFRLEASRGDVIADVMSTPAGQQAEALREIPGRNYAAALVVPDLEDAGVGAALEELRDQGVPIVLLNQTVVLKGAPLPVVTEEPLDVSARKLVEAAVADARAEGFPAHGPATVLVNGPYDKSGRDRIAALHKALADAKIEVLPDTVFQGFVGEASEAINKLLSEHPDVAIILAEEDQGARAAGPIRAGVGEGKKRFALSAFAVSKDLEKMSAQNLFSGLVQRALQKEASEAFRATLALARGEEIPDRTEVESPFSRATGPPMMAKAAIPKAATSKGSVPQSPGVPTGPQPLPEE